jgi:L-lactate dehydrogenase complex protein LldE
MADRRVAIFATCVVEMVRPRIIDATARALRAAGYEPTSAPGATCCGQPAANAGATTAARRVARHTLRRLAKLDMPIVIPSGSCTTMIRHHWPQLFAGTRDEATARAVGARTYELTEFLATQAPIVPGAAAAEGSVAYHPSCHLTRELDVVEPPRAALRAAGYTVDALGDQDRCCGFGGTFSVSFPDVSVAMADDKLDAAVACGATTITSCDLSCLIHLEGRAAKRDLALRFPHVAELLA